MSTYLSQRLFLSQANNPAVRRADDEPIVADGWSRDNGATQLDRLNERSLRQVEDIKAAVRRANINAGADNNRRAVDAILGRKTPEQIAVFALDGMHIFVAATDDDQIVRHGRGRVKRLRFLGLE